MSLEFTKELTKIELHAHINGSISERTMEKLVQSKGDNSVEDGWRKMFQKGAITSLAEAFKIFKMIHAISNDTQAQYMITYDVIHEFAAENVKYLELRTTPRDIEATGMTKELHIQAVLQAIQDCSKLEDLDITVRLLLAIDRRNPVSVAMETVELADKYAALSNGIIVGIDLSGDPTVGNAADFIPVFLEARRRGLKLALHLAEVPAVQETWDVLQILPERIGHGTCLFPDTGGSKEIVDFIEKHQIPLELCLTSNVLCQTSISFDNHHFKDWYNRDHPCILGTDDKGVFCTSLSEEYSIAADVFGLDEKTLYQMSLSAIDHIFADNSVKNKLRQKWERFKEIKFQ